MQKRDSDMRLDRPEAIMLGETTLPLPVFFPSISTVKVALAPDDYLETLCSLRDVNKQFLVSAFDLHNSDDGESVAQILKVAQETGAIILMDSGNYESYWKGAQARWTQSNYHDVLRRFPSSFAFSFDNQNPPLDAGFQFDSPPAFQNHSPPCSPACVTG